MKLYTMLTIRKELLTNQTNRPFLRDAPRYAIRELKGIVAHWTANTRPGADARANRNYFNGSAQYASAHYIVDDKVIIQCIPDNEVGYHVGANRYRPDGEKIMGNSGLSPNYFLIGFEMCVNADGDWDKTYRASVQLAAHLLHKYRFTTDYLYRHFDITGKDCPKMMLTDASWNKFKTDVQREIQHLPTAVPRKTAVVAGTDFLNVRSGGAATFPLVGRLSKDDMVGIFEEKNGWARIDGVQQRWVSMKFLNIIHTTRYGVIKSATGANVRSGAGSNFPIEDALPNGTLVSIFEGTDRWLRIGQGLWVSASLVEGIPTQQGVITGTDTLNARRGPGTNFPIVRKLNRDEEVTIFAKDGKWLRIGTDEWVFEGFINLLQA